MKNWQFWILLGVILVIGFFIMGEIWTIGEDIDFINKNVVNMGREVNRIKDVVDDTEMNVSRILLWCGESN